VLLNRERNTNVGKASRYLLTGLINCGTCGAAMFSRPRDDHTKRYLCAGRRRGHQLGILAEPVDNLVKERVLDLLTTPSVREALLAQAGVGDDRSMGRTLAALGASQARLHALDDDFYVRGTLPEGRYRSIRVKLEREIDRLHTLADTATKQRIVLIPILVRFGLRPTSDSGRIWSVRWSNPSRSWRDAPAFAGSIRLGSGLRSRHGEECRFPQLGRL